ncbi:uncharacterized protein G2W53_027112 [Senna tora]|uniref:Uncharacterized protein n=1 Tax=Senna tora TaxID=362788 RepID=A0A834TI41_9FABA|nr:uncharacterized protein G2W53_027112 [Senna tora]
MDDDVDRSRSATLNNQSPMGQMIPMTQGSLPRSFKAIRVGRPTVEQVDHGPSKINESWVKMKPMSQGNIPRSLKVIRLARGQIFDGRRRGSPSVGAYAGQNEAYDTRKPPKKFQGNPTFARPNIRRTATWITVGRPPKKFQGNPTCARPNVRRTTTWIAVGRRCSKNITHGSTFFYEKSHVHIVTGRF